MISLLNRMKLTYCARAKEDTEILTITYADLMNYQSLNHMAPLNKAIEEFKDSVIEPKNFDDKVNRFWFLDYTKNITKHKDSQRNSLRSRKRGGSKGTRMGQPNANKCNKFILAYMMFGLVLDYGSLRAPFHIK